MFPKHPSPLLRPHRVLIAGSSRREKEKSELRRTLAFAVTCAGLSQGLRPRLPGSFHAAGNCGSHTTYLCMAAFFRVWRYTHASVVTRRSAYRRSCRTVKGREPHRAASNQPAGILRTPLGPDSGRSRPGIKPFSQLSWTRLCVVGQRYGNRTRSFRLLV